MYFNEVIDLSESDTKTIFRSALHRGEICKDICRRLIPCLSRRHLEASFLRLGLPNPVLSVVEFLLMNRCGFKTVRLFTLTISLICSLTVRGTGSCTVKCREEKGDLLSVRTR